MNRGHERDDAVYRLAPTASPADTTNLRHIPELTMAPKFQKGPDLKRFMVRLMLFNNMDVTESKDWLSTRLARSETRYLSLLSFVSLAVSVSCLAFWISICCTYVNRSLFHRTNA
jgi:hypothetical protein